MIDRIDRIPVAYIPVLYCIDPAVKGIFLDSRHTVHMQMHS